jgi:hypothetical protein
MVTSVMPKRRPRLQRPWRHKEKADSGKPLQSGLP